MAKIQLQQSLLYPLAILGACAAPWHFAYAQDTEPTQTLGHIGTAPNFLAAAASSPDQKGLSLLDAALALLNPSKATPASSKATPTLPKPEQSQVFETLASKLSSFAVLERSIVQVPLEGAFLVNLAYPLPPHDPLKPFQFSERKEIKGDDGTKRRLVQALDTGLLIFNTENLSTIYLDSAFQLVSSHSMVYDLIRAPRDRGGEAPAWETAELRRAFVALVKGQEKAKFRGVSRLPRSWGTKEPLGFLVATAFKEHPFVEVACEANNPSQCSFSRSCFVEGIKREYLTQLQGLALLEKQRLLVAGDSKTNELLFFRYNSCFDIVFYKRLALPLQLKALSSLLISDDEALWVGTTQPDDYLNASLYRWDAKAWLPLLR